MQIRPKACHNVVIFYFVYVTLFEYWYTFPRWWWGCGSKKCWHYTHLIGLIHSIVHRRVRIKLESTYPGCPLTSADSWTTPRYWNRFDKRAESEQVCQVRIRRKYPERTEMFTTVKMVLTFVTLSSKIHTPAPLATARYLQSDRAGLQRPFRISIARY